MTRAIVVGDSHTACIARAAEADAQRMDEISIYRFTGKRSAPGDGSISIERAVELIGQLPPAAPVFLAILGGVHNRIGLLREDPNFDFLPDSSAAAEDLDTVEIVPRRAVASVFDFNIQDASKFLAIKRAARGSVFLIGTPPPKESNEFIMEKFSKMKKQDYRGQNIMDLTLNTPRLRQKLWELECERLRKWAADQGMFYLAAPKQSLDANSFLKECYYDDVTHANTAYGALVIEQISEIMRRQHEDVAHG